jgi:hypothetical protein
MVSGIRSSLPPLSASLTPTAQASQATFNKPVLMAGLQIPFTNLQIPTNGQELKQAGQSAVNGFNNNVVKPVQSGVNHLNNQYVKPAADYVNQNVVKPIQGGAGAVRDFFVEPPPRPAAPVTPTYSSPGFDRGGGAPSSGVSPISAVRAPRAPTQADITAGKIGRGQFSPLTTSDGKTWQIVAGGGNTRIAVDPSTGLQRPFAGKNGPPSSEQLFRALSPRPTPGFKTPTPEQMMLPGVREGFNASMRARAPSPADGMIKRPDTRSLELTTGAARGFFVDPMMGLFKAGLTGGAFNYGKGSTIPVLRSQADMSSAASRAERTLAPAEGLIDRGLSATGLNPGSQPSQTGRAIGGLAAAVRSGVGLGRGGASLVRAARGLRTEPPIMPTRKMVPQGEQAALPGTSPSQQLALPGSSQYRVFTMDPRAEITARGGQTVANPELGVKVRTVDVYAPGAQSRPVLRKNAAVNLGGNTPTYGTKTGNEMQLPLDKATTIVVRDKPTDVNKRAIATVDANHNGVHGSGYWGNVVGGGHTRSAGTPSLGSEKNLNVANVAPTLNGASRQVARERGQLELGGYNTNTAGTGVAKLYKSLGFEVIPEVKGADPSFVFNGASPGNLSVSRFHIRADLSNGMRLSPSGFSPGSTPPRAAGQPIVNSSRGSSIGSAQTVGTNEQPVNVDVVGGELRVPRNHRIAPREDTRSPRDVNTPTSGGTETVRVGDGIYSVDNRVRAPHQRPINAPPDRSLHINGQEHTGQSAPAIGGEPGVGPRAVQDTPKTARPQQGQGTGTVELRPRTLQRFQQTDGNAGPSKLPATWRDLPVGRTESMFARAADGARQASNAVGSVRNGVNKTLQGTLGELNEAFGVIPKTFQRTATPQQTSLVNTASGLAAGITNGVAKAQRLVFNPTTVSLGVGAGSVLAANFGGKVINGEGTPYANQPNSSMPGITRIVSAPREGRSTGITLDPNNPTDNFVNASVRWPGLGGAGLLSVRPSTVTRLQGKSMAGGPANISTNVARGAEASLSFNLGSDVLGVRGVGSVNLGGAANPPYVTAVRGKDGRLQPSVASASSLSRNQALGYVGVVAGPSIFAFRTGAGNGLLGSSNSTNGASARLGTYQLPKSFVTYNNPAWGHSTSSFGRALHQLTSDPAREPFVFPDAQLPPNYQSK